MSLFVEFLNWRQIEDALKTVRTLVIPVGARCKEHGLHLPVNTDAITAEYLARRVAEQVDVLVLPTVSYGHYPAFIDYPGSVSIEAATFGALIADICRSFARHGDFRYYVLNTGISTITPLEAARQVLLSEKISMDFSDLRNLAAAERKAVEQQSHGSHADELETSMLLYIAPDVVHLELAEPELAPDARGGLSPTPATKGVYSRTGAWGDPTLATREKGERIVEAMVKELIQILR